MKKSDPTTASERYTGPITVQDMTSQPNKYSARTDITAYTDILAPDEGVLKAAVVRAIAVDSQGRTSSIATKTYFVGSTNVDKYKNMKVISLVTDPSNLFDYEKGIYVTGKVYEEGGGGMGFGGMNFGGGNWNMGGDANGGAGGFNMGNFNMITDIIQFYHSKFKYPLRLPALIAATLLAILYCFIFIINNM